MERDVVKANRVIRASAEAVFDVLADPVQHASIDGTGWVVDVVDADPLVESGQLFRMAMFHEGHYVTVNQVLDFDRPTTISWRTGYEDEQGVHFSGWFWLYDLVPTGRSVTDVTLTYDWTAVPDETRELSGFPPFPPAHLSDSLSHVADLVVS